LSGTLDLGAQRSRSKPNGQPPESSRLGDKKGRPKTAFLLSAEKSSARATARMRGEFCGRPRRHRDCLTRCLPIYGVVSTRSPARRRPLTHCRLARPVWLAACTVARSVGRAEARRHRLREDKPAALEDKSVSSLQVGMGANHRAAKFAPCFGLVLCEAGDCRDDFRSQLRYAGRLGSFKAIA
jgi:hypothetical protein